MLTKIFSFTRAMHSNPFSWQTFFRYNFDVQLVDGTDASIRRFLKELPGVDQVGAEARAAMLATRSIKTASKKWAIDCAISMIDLTTLEGSDTDGKVRVLLGEKLELAKV